MLQRWAQAPKAPRGPMPPVAKAFEMISTAQVAKSAAEARDLMLLRPTDGSSFCEWKGAASYLDLVAGGRTAARAAWTYPDPSPGFEALRDHVALYPGLVDRCLVDGEVVEPQPGGFYGGWITSAVVGPFKGEPGTWGW